MQVYSFSGGTAPLVLALGLFDSVHRGHQAVFSAAVELSKKQGAAPAAFTFSGNVKGLPLYSEEERLRLFAGCGMQAAVVVPFSEEIKNLSGEAFFEALRARFPLRGVVCGYDYRFGANAACGAEELGTFCQKAGIPLTVVPAECDGGEKISTTAVKAALSSGDLAAAVRLLGRNYALTGNVGEGYRLGRTLGFPTANLKAEGRFLPKPGVYAALAAAEGKTYRAVVNLGAAPTVFHDEVLLEAHLDGFFGDLYGKTLRVEFLFRLRDTVKFESKAALSAQLQADVFAVRRAVKLPEGAVVGSSENTSEKA